MFLFLPWQEEIILSDKKDDTLSKILTNDREIVNTFQINLDISWFKVNKFHS